MAPGSKFLQFHPVFRKIWQNRMLAPPPEGLAPPPRGNAGSATDARQTCQHCQWCAICENLVYVKMYPKFTSFFFICLQ